MSRKTRVLLALALTLSLLVGAIVPAAAAVPQTWVVDASGNDNDLCGAGDNPCKTIGYAIGRAQSGDTIQVLSGTYVEGTQVVIDKHLWIQGAGSENTIITPSADTGSSGDARGWFLVQSGVELNLSGVTLDGASRNVYQAVRHLGIGSIGNVAFKNIGYPGYQGTGVAAMGGEDGVDISGCTFENIGRIGVIYYGPGTAGTFSGNTYTGKGEGDHLDYAVEVGGGAVATIAMNNVSEMKGVASSDGSVSGAFLVTDLYGPGTAATIRDNTVRDSSYGVLLGYNDSDASVATITGNTFTNNLVHIDDGRATPEIGTFLAANTFDRAVTVKQADDSLNPRIYGNIQRALVGADAGATVTVAAGTYVEEGQIVIDKSLTIVGAGAESTTIMPAGDTTTVGKGSNPPGDGSGWWLVTSDGALNLSGVTLDAEGKKVVSAVLSYGGGRIENSVIKNVAYDASIGFGVFVYGGTTAVVGNEFSGITRVGVEAKGTGTDVLVQGNQFTGKGVVDGAGLDYAVEVGGGGKATIVGNSISGFVGVVSDSDQSAGILVSTLYGDGSTATILDNDISNCYDGIKVGYTPAYPDSSAVTAHFNRITGMAHLGVYTVQAVVDAANNWWGDGSGPTHTSNPGGAGAGVSNLVDYDPWLGATTAAVVIEQLDNGASIELQDEGTPVVQASYTGSAPATVALAAYDSNPGSTVIGTEGDFFDVNLLGAPADATLSVKFFFASDPGPLYWYDGATWKLVRNNDGSKPLYAEGYIQATFGPTSSPTVAQLTGTPFGTGLAAQIRIVPAAYDVLIPGDKVAVYVEGYASDLYAAEFKVTWDDTMLSASADDITLGSWLSPDAVVVKQVNGNEAWIGFSQQGGRASVSGTGYLAAINFTVLQAGTTEVAFSYVKLSDPEGFEIPVDAADMIPGSLTISATGGIKGYATLQGRTNHAGVTIAITPGEVDPVGSDALGAFGLTGLRPYTGEYAARASFPGYLTAVHTGIRVVSGVDTELELVKLLGGDATHDQLINIQDLAYIGAGNRFGQTGLGGQDAWADINGDTKVDILDVALAGVNFGKAAPQLWGHAQVD